MEESEGDSYEGSDAEAGSKATGFIAIRTAPIRGSFMAVSNMGMERRTSRTGIGTRGCTRRASLTGGADTTGATVAITRGSSRQVTGKARGS